MELLNNLPPTTTRVPQNTFPSVNERIRQQLERNVARFEGAPPEEIDARIRELEQEWDIERTLEANAATITVISVGLAATVNKKWLALTGVVGGFLLQHALQGWCPPVVPFRHAKIRTQTEIEQEIAALRLLRGDLQATPHWREAVDMVLGDR